MKKIVSFLVVFMLLMSFMIVAHANEHSHVGDECCLTSITHEKDDETIKPYYIECPVTGGMCNWQFHSSYETEEYSYTYTVQVPQPNGNIRIETYDVYRVYQIRVTRCICGNWGPESRSYIYNREYRR